MKLPDNSHPPVLIVDDEPYITEACEFVLHSMGLKNTISCLDSREVMKLLDGQEFSAVLLDLAMPQISGEELLEKISRTYPEVPVIIITGKNDVTSAVDCMRVGAFDYLVKPVSTQRMGLTISRAIELRGIQREYSSFKERVLTDTLDHAEAFSEIVSQNSKMRSLFQYVEAIARTARPVLIVGETGVGKELFAKALHTLSGRSGNFVPVNLAGVDDQMLADTLFGHSKGAYTGADQARPGLIMAAENGTLFLDEIGDLPDISQIKLLRLLQDGEYRPIGTDIARRSNARVVLASNVSISELKKLGRFRPDLLYRLQSHQISIPPLRERIDDLPGLVSHFMKKSACELGKRIPTPPKELIALLATYHFPGNVRELEAMIFDAVSRHETKILSMTSIKDHIAASRSLPRVTPPAENGGAESSFSLFEELPTLKEAQRLLIEEAMRRSQGNQTLAAHLLGITQSGLNKALKRERLLAG